MPSESAAASTAALPTVPRSGSSARRRRSASPSSSGSCWRCGRHPGASARSAGIAILYWATPNAQQPKFRWISLGALLAFLTLVISSFLFGLYVTIFSNYDRTYDSLAGIVVFLLWLRIANLALLFGAEFDAELEQGRELQAGIAAEEELQLPPRDTRKSDKVADKVQEDIAIGRRLRLNRRTSDDSESKKKK
ncbi:YihY/virulence factor BrkB family protein [Cryobacterium sp. TMT2-4]|uniref:YihY/virulence factor BrkB family protein n=1 Tax=Cryobacterium sp. TMT2-4 TaxID=1259254 RepID=UPI003515246D